MKEQQAFTFNIYNLSLIIVDPAKTGTKTVSKLLNETKHDF